MAGNEVTLTIAGDATQLQRAASQAEQAMNEVADSVNESSREMSDAGGETRNLGDRLGNLGAGVEGLTGALDSAAAGFQAMADLQSLSARRADETKRNLLAVEQAAGDLEQAYGDLEQAQLDLNQAFVDNEQAALDVKQSQIDAKQAALDAATAQDEYNKAVKEHGKNSAEAQQAAIDLEQAYADLEQAGIDTQQAQADMAQADADSAQASRDMTQAARDARGAQLDLNEAQRAANPSGLQKVADTLAIVTPLMTALISVVALATAAQWLWNIAMTANPIGLIVVAVAAVIAGIVLLATQVDWFGDFWVDVWDVILAAFKLWWSVFSAMWKAIINFFVTLIKGWWDLFSGFWNGVYNLAKGVVKWFMDIPGMLKSAFSGLFSIITSPFRAAFNFVSTAWNNTVGRLRWTVPSWVPGVGGNSISAPRLPTYHGGGVVPGPPGTEVPILAQAGETVTPRGMSTSSPAPSWLPTGDVLADLVLEALAGRIRARGGDPSILGIANG